MILKIIGAIECALALVVIASIVFIGRSAGMTIGDGE
jgi:hypothetical protein